MVLLGRAHRIRGAPWLLGIDGHTRTVKRSFQPCHIFRPYFCKYGAIELSIQRRELLCGHSYRDSGEIVFQKAWIALPKRFDTGEVGCGGIAIENDPQEPKLGDRASSDGRVLPKLGLRGFALLLL